MAATQVVHTASGTALVVNGVLVDPTGASVVGQVLSWNGSGFVPGSSSAGLDVTSFPGAPDLGLQINNADAALGATPGTLFVPAGDYVINTQVVLSANRTLILSAGTYVSHTQYETFLLRDNNKVIGDGWDKTIIQESDDNSNERSIRVFQTYKDNGYIDSTPGGAVQNNIELAYFKIIHGWPGTPGGGSSTITLGNVHNAKIHDIWFESNTGFSFQIGGSSEAYFPTLLHAQDVWATGNIIQGKYAAVVNAVNFHINDNLFVGTGLDCEINTANDAMSNFSITNNVFDLTTVTGFGLLVQAPSSVFVGNGGTISGNQFLGGEVGGAGPTTGIVINTCPDIMICNNNLQGLWQQIAIDIEAGVRNTVSNNRIQASRSTGIRLNNSTYTSVTANSIYGEPVYGDSGFASIEELGTSDHNYIFGNYLQYWNQFSITEPSIRLLGANSRAYNNVLNGRLVGGPPHHARRVVNANGNILDTDDILGVDTSTTAITLTLPDPATINLPTDSWQPFSFSGIGPSLVYTIQDEKSNASIKNITISPHGAEKINGVAASIVISNNGARVHLYTDGTDWFADTTFPGGATPPPIGARAVESLLTTTSATNVATYTPSTTKGLTVHMYYRVVTGTTNVTVDVTYTDVTGAQTVNAQTLQAKSTGSYAMLPVFIVATSAAVTVTVTAGTANQVYFSSSIVEA